MSWAELFLIAVGLAMDAFAVSIAKGISVDKVKFKYAMACALYFGFFQGFMPFIGHMVGGVSFSHIVTAYDHWIAFGLLALIGLSMIKESRQEKEEDADFSPRTMLTLAIATSIDAFAVGISFAFLEVAIVPAVLLIGIVTMVLSFFGVKLGFFFGSKLRSRAEVAGGIILIAIGTKILLEHLGII